MLRQLPASERFFAGGDTTVRGFALDRLGTAETLDPQGFPQGGNGMAIFNLETRAPYWKNVQFVWFVDAGNIFSRVADIRLDELRVSSGVGVRYRSPIGPLRVDWGWKLSTQLAAGRRARTLERAAYFTGAGILRTLLVWRDRLGWEPGTGSPELRTFFRLPAPGSRLSQLNRNSSNARSRWLADSRSR